ncbi:hypothetical protein ACFQL7_21905 [Halocatena marina]|uniref:Uncharacterized protein n=1 Tax=Halocatena marina TaxID=2934937 RepID=A0ABD5YUX8_9EURY
MTDTDRDEPSEKTSDLITDINKNLRHAVSILADKTHSGESQQFGTLMVASAGVPVPLFNRVFVFDIPPIGELSAAVTWIAERDVSFWVTVTDPAIEVVENHCADLDLVKVAEHPGMAMTSLDEIPPRDSTAEITEVNNSDECDKFSTVTASALEMPLVSQNRSIRPLWRQTIFACFSAEWTAALLLPGS